MSLVGIAHRGYSLQTQCLWSTTSSVAMGTLFSWAKGGQTNGSMTMLLVYTTCQGVDGRWTVLEGRRSSTCRPSICRHNAPMQLAHLTFFVPTGGTSPILLAPRGVASEVCENVEMYKSEQLTTIPIPVGFGTGAAEIESISTTSSRRSQSTCVVYRNENAACRLQWQLWIRLALLRALTNHQGLGILAVPDEMCFRESYSVPELVACTAENNDTTYVRI